MQHALRHRILAVSFVLVGAAAAQTAPLAGPAFPVANGADSSLGYDPRSDLYLAAYTKPVQFGVFPVERR
ncbi:MAG: hypothetical protein AAF628_37335 [Planctomycetota bacterium]